MKTQELFRGKNDFFMDGILNVIKPIGVSSFSFMRKVQRKLGIKKIGHLGTLDPNACGVLVLLCGKATKLNQKLSGGTKVYRSVFTFGIETDTLDTAGEVIVKSDIIPTAEQLRHMLPVGETEITIPKFSAVHIGGERAYDLARKGIDFTPPTKTVTIHRFEIINFAPEDAALAVRRETLASNEFYFEIECQTGTYVRSLAKLVAKRLGTVAIASSIIRTRVGDFDIKTAKCLEDVTTDDIIQVEGK